MNPQFIAAAQEWLSAHAGLSPERAAVLGQVAARLVSALPASPPLTIAISGPPGTGKSTLAGACASGLQATGATPVVLSLDDYYLSRAVREKRAREIHPLAARRGPPGTHDIQLLLKHLDAIRSGTPRLIRIPHFDKSRDDRSDHDRELEIAGPPSHILFEGWLLGARPQGEAALRAPVNALEAREDPGATWRRWANTQLGAYQRALGARVDVHWHLQAPDWDCVIDWRWLQEQQHAKRWLQDRHAVQDFLAPFQRIGLHMHDHAEHWADVLVTLDRDHHPHTRHRP
ncbi:MAG: kinase [Xanthomonadales bacterium]|nr:kinase [Xanthomonadales bacterium]